jgi:hypothetical protein
MRMKGALGSTVVLLLVLGAAVSVREQPAKKPVKERTIHSAGGLGAPPSLPELYAMSPLVIDATVQMARPVDQIIKSTSSLPDTVIVMTAHGLAVNEVFKDAIPGGIKGKRIELTQLGGERDRGDYIESVVDERFPPLKRGERYVFFLKPSTANDGTYLVSTGSPDGVLALDPDGTVKARGSSRLARDLERYTNFDLINALRDLREGR